MRRRYFQANTFHLPNLNSSRLLPEENGRKYLYVDIRLLLNNKVQLIALAVVLAKSGVSKSLEGGKTYFGIPAEEVREKYRELATLRMLSARK